MVHWRFRLGAVLASLAVLATACAPAAQPSPTVAPTTPTNAPTEPGEAPTAAPAAQPAASPAAKSTAAFDEAAVADFYRGKTIRFIVGYAAGGSFDVSSRIIAKHLPQYLPGSPTVIVENKPGAGSILAANLVYGAEPRDGTVIASINEYLALQQAIGAAGIEFDAAKFQWLGSGNKTFSVCVARTDSGIDNVQELMSGEELVIGTTGPGSNPHDIPAVLNATLGTNFKIVPGYDGIPKVRLAVQNKEVDGYCQTFDTLITVAKAMVEGDDPLVKVIVAMGDETPDHPILKGVPAAETLAKNDDDRILLRAINAPAQMTRPLAVAPGVPADRVAALRQAIARTLADPEVQAALQQAGVEGTPSSAEEVTQIVQQLLDTPPATLDRLKTILK